MAALIAVQAVPEAVPESMPNPESKFIVPSNPTVEEEDPLAGLPFDLYSAMETIPKTSLPTFSVSPAIFAGQNPLLRNIPTFGAAKPNPSLLGSLANTFLKMKNADQSSSRFTTPTTGLQDYGFLPYFANRFNEQYGSKLGDVSEYHSQKSLPYGKLQGSSSFPYQSFIRAFTAMNEDVFVPALPVFRRSFPFMIKAIPSLCNDLSRYRQSLLVGADNNMSFQPFPRQAFMTLMEILMALNDVLERMLPIAPEVYNAVSLVTQEFPEIVKMFPSFTRYLSTYVATRGFQPEHDESPTQSLKNKFDVDQLLDLVSRGFRTTAESDKPLGYQRYSQYNPFTDGNAGQRPKEFEDSYQRFLNRKH